jgi:hypothetical protein
VTGITSATITFEATVNGTDWVSIQAANTATGARSATATADGVYTAPVAGLQRVRARISTYATGTIYVTALASTEAAVDSVAVSTINSVSPQFDDTDKLAASVYGRSTTAGDTAIGCHSAGYLHTQVMAIQAGDTNIGNVDIVTLPTSVQGAGNPTVDSYSTAVINLAASTADQVIVADPGASKQIWVYACFMMADTAAGTVTFQDDADTALSGVMAVSDEGGWVLPHSGNFAMPWIQCTTNKALEVDTGACTIDGIICYAIVSV